MGAQSVLTPRSNTALILDVDSSLQNPSYKVVGLLAWLIVGSSIAGVFLFPRPLLEASRILAYYLVARLILSLVYYVVGRVYCRRWESYGWAERNRDNPQLDKVHHVVIIPNYKEPVAILERTLESLAVQDQAQSRLTVVLAMEERETGARAKAEALRTRFGEQFAHLLITLHPADLPGEVVGKGSNQAWAALQAKRELVDRLGMSLEWMTVTSCDADSVLHPSYYAALTRLFAEDPQRQHRFWYAPIIYNNNIASTVGPIRLMALFSNGLRLGQLTNPLEAAFPVSVYSLSFQMAHEAGYWDPAVISEDWHMYLRCIFATQGKASLRPIYLPTSVDVVCGETVGQALTDYYRQQVRHSWGAEDVGYVLQQIRRRTGTPLYIKLRWLLRLLYDNLLRSSSWFVLAAGTLIPVLYYVTPEIAASGHALQPILTQLGRVFGASGSILMWISERIRCQPKGERLQRSMLVQDLISWALLPIITLVFGALPSMYAQSKLLVGSEMTFRRTPKSMPV
jgi:cellulose synthase/poly-beta-1,6-N-acetylglucosamine synthase-like glycosyltransferase